MSSEQTEKETLKTEEKHKNEPLIDQKELINLTKNALKNIIESDPLLNDLPPDPTIDEITAQIELVKGQSIKLFLDRGRLPKLTVVVDPKNTTVLDLKKAIKRCTNLALERENVHKKISWKHIWRKYNICYDDLPLLNDHENIDNYGICNKATLRYVKKRREKK